jgi:hypothetical protein
MEKHEQTKKINIKEAILAKIKKEELRMKPKTYFMLKLAALVAVLLGVLIFSVFICNFILFSIRVSGHGTLLSFGPQGVLQFLRFFPWLYLILDIALIVLLEWLVRQFRFGYKIPALRLLFGILLFTMVVSVFIDRVTPFNDKLLDKAEHHHLSQPLGNFYEHARRPPPPDSGVCRCTILTVEGNTVTAESADHEDALFTIVVPENNAQIDYDSLKVGNTVFVAGRFVDGILHAFGIHALR